MYCDIKQLSNGVGRVVCGASVFVSEAYITSTNRHLLLCSRQGREIDALIP